MSVIDFLNNSPMAELILRALTIVYYFIMLLIFLHQRANNIKYKRELEKKKVKAYLLLEGRLL